MKFEVERSEMSVWQHVELDPSVHAPETDEEVLASVARAHVDAPPDAPTVRWHASDHDNVFRKPHVPVPEWRDGARLWATETIDDRSRRLKKERRATRA